MPQLTDREIPTPSLRFEPLWLITFQAPPADVERIMTEVCKVASLAIGNYDCCAYQTAAGTERYRPLQGAAAGAETDIRLRPGIVEVSFQIMRDEALLTQVTEAIFAVHSYEEPVITVQDMLASRTRGPANKDNPHRWWNQGGDWKTAATSS